MVVLETAGLAAGKFVAGKVAKAGADHAGEKTGINSKLRSAKSYISGVTDIPIDDITANQFLRNTVKYVFYKNFIMGKRPNQAELDTMLYLLAITIHKGIIKSVLYDMGISDKGIMTKFYNKDYSFLDNEQKNKFINKLITIDPTKRTIEEDTQFGAIMGSEGGGKKQRRRSKKRKYKTKKKSKKRRTRKKSS